MKRCLSFLLLLFLFVFGAAAPTPDPGKMPRTFMRDAPSFCPSR